MNKTKEIQISWVDELPMVNITDSFVATKAAKEHFEDDLKDFFCVYMEKYFWRKAFTISTRYGENNRIQLFVTNSRPPSLRNLPSFSIGTIPENINRQKTLAREYLHDAKSFLSLSKKLSKSGCVNYGLQPQPSLMSISTLDDLIFAIHPKGHPHFTLITLRLFSVFLYHRQRFIWPLRPVDGERDWSRFTAKYGHLIGEWCLNEMPRNSTSCAFRIIRSTRWHSWHDLTDNDVFNIREKIREIHRSNSSMITALNCITREAIRNGNTIKYETRSARISKVRKTGRLDGSFSFFKQLEERSTSIRYWTQNARSFYLYERDEGRQNLQTLAISISKWIDYLCHLEKKARCPRSIVEVKRIDHIVMNYGVRAKDFSSFPDWAKKKGMSKGVRRRVLTILKQFFYWIISKEGLNILCPIQDIDIPSQSYKSPKSHRPALSLKQWLHIRDIIINRPPPYLEIVDIDEDKNPIRKESPTLRTYALLRLELGIRDAQGRYLDKNTILGPDGFVISGDKNINRKFSQIIPYFDDVLKEKVQECIDWQNRFNHPTDSVWYGGNSNSPFGKIIPLFRLISPDPTPIARSTAFKYMLRILLKYQKEAGLQGERQIIHDKDGCSLDMSQIDPDKISGKRIIGFKTEFDLHSLRVTAATIWYEAGVPLEIIREFITGHATMTMLLHYVKIRNADKVLKDAFFNLMKKQAQIKKGLLENTGKTLEFFRLSSRRLRSEDNDLDGVQALKNTPGAFWRFFHYGICPSGACPNGLDGRCGVCSLLISGPAFKAGITVQFNMAISQAMITGLEIRKVSSKDTNREPLIQSQVQELTGWIGWLRYIEQLEAEATADPQNKLALYSQTEYNPHLMKTSPVIHELQRCVDIQYCPEVWTENTFWRARAFLMTLISKLPKVKDSYKLVKELTPDAICTKVASYFLGFIESGKTFEEIEAVFTDDNYELTISGLPEIIGESLKMVTT